MAAPNEHIFNTSFRYDDVCYCECIFEKIIQNYQPVMEVEFLYMD